MCKRNQNFLDVFSSHISTLIYETGPEQEQFLLKLNPEQQLLFIEQNFFIIQKSKKGKEALRMEGICQSYNAKDSALYRDLKFMQEILDGTKKDDLDEVNPHDHQHHNHEEKKVGGADLSHYDSQQQLIGLGHNDDALASVTKSIEMVPTGKKTPAFIGGDKIAKIGVAPIEYETDKNVIYPIMVSSNS